MFQNTFGTFDGISLQLKPRVYGLSTIEILNSYCHVPKEEGFLKNQ
jgi:hypothetical protein